MVIPMEQKRHDPEPPRFAAYFKVRHYEADTLGHVNNAAYLHYLEQAAIEHSSAVGYTSEKYRELGGAFIVRRHEIDYLLPAAPGDVLQVVTWPIELGNVRATRGYEVYRYLPAGAVSATTPADGFLTPDAPPTGHLLVRAQTVWVWIDDAGHPRRMPKGLAEAFLTAR
jgi:acyl-CoA thioester hydrolase